MSTATSRVNTCTDLLLTVDTEATWKEIKELPRIQYPTGWHRLCALSSFSEYQAWANRSTNINFKWVWKVIMLLKFKILKAISYNSYTYLMLGNKSDTMPLNNLRSSTKNLGTLTSLMALSTISSYRNKKTQNSSYNYCIFQADCKKLYRIYLMIKVFLPRSCLGTASWGYRQLRWQTSQLSYQSHNDPTHNTKFNQLTGVQRTVSRILNTSTVFIDILCIQHNMDNGLILQHWMWLCITRTELFEDSPEWFLWMIRCYDSLNEFNTWKMNYSEDSMNYLDNELYGGQHEWPRKWFSQRTAWII